MSAPYYFPIVVFLLLLAGCKTTAIKPPPVAPIPPALRSLPADVNPLNTPENIQLQLDLAKRNLYQTRDGHVRLLSTQACTIDLIAHRGHANYPENSISAVKAAFAAGFDKVEIDIMRLRDGNWVVHHDAMVGRASGFASGENASIASMRMENFAKLRLRDPKSLQLTPEFAASLTALIDAIAPEMKANQRLQIEFKSAATQQELIALDQFLTKKLGQRYEYVAQDIDLLAQLRQLNTWVYLGIIEVPATSSMQALGRQKAAAQGMQPSRLSRWAEQKSQQAYRRTRINWLTEQGMQKVRTRLGSHAGIHVDHAALTQQPTASARAKKINLPIYTYSVTPPAQHLSALKQLKDKGALPAGAIVDDSPLKICTTLFNGIVTTPLSPAKTSLVLRLPSDADFSVLAEQERLSVIGQYRKLSGDIAQIASANAASKPSTQTQNPVLLNVEFKTLSDENIDLSTDGAVRIYLQDKKNP